MSSPEPQPDPVTAADQALEMANEGRVTAARRSIAQALDDNLPAVPLRFTVGLIHIADTQVRALLEARAVIGQFPPLLLAQGASKGTYSVWWFAGKVGQLNARDAEMLTGLGEAASWFSIRVAELRVAEDGRTEALLVELSRPELRVCASCGKMHASNHVNCDECRAAGKRKKGAESKTFESAPVPLARALEALATIEHGDPLDDDEADPDAA